MAENSQCRPYRVPYRQPEQGTHRPVPCGGPPGVRVRQGHGLPGGNPPRLRRRLDGTWSDRTPRRDRRVRDRPGLHQKTRRDGAGPAQSALACTSTRPPHASSARSRSDRAGQAVANAASGTP